MKYIESFVFIDNSGPMARHEGMTSDVVTKLSLLAGNMGAVSCTTRSVPSILDIFADPESWPQIRTESGVTKLVFCVSSGESEDGTSRVLIERELGLLPPEVYLIFATIGTSDVTKVWFEYLVKHPAYGKKFAIMREYAEESIEDEFTRCIGQLLGR